MRHHAQHNPPGPWHGGIGRGSNHARVERRKKKRCSETAVGTHKYPAGLLLNIRLFLARWPRRVGQLRHYEGTRFGRIDGGEVCLKRRKEWVPADGARVEIRGASRTRRQRAVGAVAERVVARERRVQVEGEGGRLAAVWGFLNGLWSVTHSAINSKLNKIGRKTRETSARCWRCCPALAIGAGGNG